MTTSNQQTEPRTVGEAKEQVEHYRRALAKFEADRDDFRELYAEARAGGAGDAELEHIAGKGQAVAERIEAGEEKVAELEGRIEERRREYEAAREEIREATERETPESETADADGQPEGATLETPEAGTPEEGERAQIQAEREALHARLGELDEREAALDARETPETPTKEEDGMQNEQLTEAELQKVREYRESEGISPMEAADKVRSERESERTMEPGTPELPDKPREGAVPRENEDLDGGELAGMKRDASSPRSLDETTRAMEEAEVQETRDPAEVQRMERVEREREEEERER